MKGVSGVNVALGSIYPTGSAEKEDLQLPNAGIIRITKMFIFQFHSIYLIGATWPCRADAI
jgi:hypothetical protein